MKKFLLTLLVVTLLIPVSVKAEETALGAGAKSVILMEASTGEIIFERNADEKLAPASMTKTMAMLLIMEAIDKGIIKWDEIVTVSENASSMGGSQILLETGEKMSVEDLFKGVAIASGNDAVVALGEKIAGTEAMFVSMMNDRAKALGLKNTNFKNPHGLDAANHYSSARDMAIIARELLKYPKVLEYTSVYETYLREKLDTKIWLVNTNKLVRFYEGVDGLKTGFTETAGYCLTTTAKKDNMRLISVVLGYESSKDRNAEVSSMLDYAFAQYSVDTLLKKTTVLGKVEVSRGKKRYAEIVPLYDINFLNKKVNTKKERRYEVKMQKVTAPVKHGDVVGKVIVYEDGKKVREVELTVKEKVSKASIFRIYFRHLGDIITGRIEL